MHELEAFFYASNTEMSQQSVVAWEWNKERTVVLSRLTKWMDDRSNTKSVEDCNVNLSS